MTLSSPFVFANPRDLANFVALQDANEQNKAQNQLYMRICRLQQRTTQSKKRKLGTDVGTQWNDLQVMELSSGYDDWWETLKRKENSSALEEDIVMLIKAFGMKRWAWRFSRFPNIQQLSKHPHEYGNLLLFVMRQYAVAKDHIEQGHTSVNETREDKLGGGNQSLDRQTASREPTNERGDIITNASCDVNRSDDGETPKAKRVCLQPQHPNTSQASDIKIIPAKNTTSPLALGPDQEPRVPTNPEQQSDIVEASTPMEPCITTHKLIRNRQVQTLEGFSTCFQYYGQSDLDGTGDCVLEYYWTGYSACKFLTGKPLLIEKDEGVSCYQVPPDCIKELPHEDLKRSMMCSETWVQSSRCKWSKCLTIRLLNLDVSNPEFAAHNESSIPYASIKCIVPKEHAPKKIKLEYC